MEILKILYLGTICDLDDYERMLDGSKIKPSIAAVIFELGVIRGLSENNADTKIISYPMIPYFPKSRVLVFGGHTDFIYSYPCRFLRTINFPIVKQWIRRVDARHILKKWAEENRGKGIILSYSIPPFLVKDVLHYAKQYNLKTVAIVPDLLENMYINHRGNCVINFIRQRYLSKALSSQSSYDGYVYLTEPMREKVSCEKPYMVMEGILNKDDFSDEVKVQSSCRGIMYAGCMHEKYGVINLVEAFQQLRDLDAELWLFGEGTASEEIQERAQKDNRIKYFGRVNREVVLEYEKKATLLVNPRSVQEEFTKYSFPSKTIEYMASGTALLTTRLEGIPKEYFNYVFSVEDNDVELLKKAIGKIFLLSDQELILKGENARIFVLEQKNAKVQVARIIGFLKSLLEEDHEIDDKEQI